MMQETEKFYDFLKDIKGLSDKTIYHYLYYYGKFMGTEVTQDNILLFLKSKKNNSVSRGFMKSYLQFLNREKEFDLPLPPRGTKKKKFIHVLPEIDYKKIFQYAYKKDFSKGFILEMIYYGALRREELLGVRVCDFVWSDWVFNNEEHCRLHVTGKGKKDRFVLIPPSVISKLFEYLLEKGLITTSMTLDAIVTLLSQTETLLVIRHPRDVLQTVYDMSYEAIGIKLRTHELRHAYATHLEEKGADIRDIQRYLGHSSTAVTEIYLHTDEKKSLVNIQNLIREKK